MKYLEHYKIFESKITQTISDLDNTYDYFHLSWDRYHINPDGVTFTFTPRVPDTPYGYEVGTIEDDFTNRVSLSDSIINCLYALPEGVGSEKWYIYGYKGDASNILDTRKTFKNCPIGYGKDFDLNVWISSLPMDEQKEINEQISKLDIVNISDLPIKYRNMFHGCVPDANDNVEFWSLEPITMKYLGYISDETYNVYDPNILNTLRPSK